MLVLITNLPIVSAVETVQTIKKIAVLTVVDFVICIISKYNFYCNELTLCSSHLGFIVNIERLAFLG